MIDAVKPDVSDEENPMSPYLRIVYAFDSDKTASEFLREDGDGGFAGAVYRMAREIDALRSAALTAPAQPVASIVPARCSGSAFVFVNGCLHVKKDGSGYIVVDEDDFVLEDDRDGEGGSVHWITRFPAGEMTALRDFLNGQQFAAAPQPPAEGGWRDIASAPVGKSGYSWMLLAYGPEGDQSVSIGMRFQDKFYAGGTFYVGGPFDQRQYGFKELEVTPSHWMPLPPTPTNGGEQNG